MGFKRDLRCLENLSYELLLEVDRLTDDHRRAIRDCDNRLDTWFDLAGRWQILDHIPDWEYSIDWDFGPVKSFEELWNEVS